MKPNSAIRTKPSKRVLYIIAGILLLLMIPFIAMQFTQEVNWTGFDFLVAAAMLFGTAFATEIIRRKVNKTYLKVVALITLFSVLFLLWAELAIGIFGSPLAGN